MHLDTHLPIDALNFRFYEPPLDLSPKAGLFALAYGACSHEVSNTIDTVDSEIDFAIRKPFIVNITFPEWTI